MCSGSSLITTGAVSAATMAAHGCICPPPPRMREEPCMNLRQLDKKYFGRGGGGEPEDIIVGNSADSFLTDARGRKYIDFMMGWCVGNLGWGNTEILAAVRKFDGPEYV